MVGQRPAARSNGAFSLFLHGSPDETRKPSRRQQRRPPRRRLPRPHRLLGCAPYRAEPRHRPRRLGRGRAGTRPDRARRRGAGPAARALPRTRRLRAAAQRRRRPFRRSPRAGPRRRRDHRRRRPRVPRRRGRARPPPRARRRLRRRRPHALAGRGDRGGDRAGNPVDPRHRAGAGPHRPAAGAAADRDRCRRRAPPRARWRR